MTPDLYAEIPVLDKGFVRLDGALADDLSVVNAARVSFANRREVMSADDVALVKFLLKNHHGTPFEHNAMRFHVKCPIFVAREWFRHRIGSFNEWSGRYSVLEPEFYIPDFVRTQVGKPGAYVFEPVRESVANDVRESLSQTYRTAYQSYEEMLEDGIAKELARLVLPVGIYTQFYWTVNARSLMNFLNLRSAETAMHEIRQYSLNIEGLLAGLMPVTYAAWMECGRVAP